MCGAGLPRLRISFLKSRASKIASTPKAFSTWPLPDARNLPCGQFAHNPPSFFKETTGIADGFLFSIQNTRIEIYPRCAGYAKPDAAEGHQRHPSAQPA